MTSHANKLTVPAVIFVLCVGCDQITKYLARELLSPDSGISLVHDTIRLQYTENKGALLSVGASLPEGVRFLLFTVSVALVLAVLLFYLVSSRSLPVPASIAISLVLGGGTSNLIDRLVFDGVVIDFLNLGIGRLRTGMFNVADIAIFGGVGLLIGVAIFDSSSAQTGSDPPRR
jgi:signal peptidase II